jgi:leader peptidase (prepilin peptidase) / N-methyltransferase
MQCSTMISWYDNLPVVSWIFLRGRCRSCKTAISWRYPFVESATAVLWVSCWLVFYFSGESLPLPLAAVTAASRAVFCYLLLGLAVMDWETLLLPDEFTWTGIGLGVLWQIFWCLLNATSTKNAIEAILLVVGKIAIAAFVVLGIRWIYQQVRHREGMGLGDAKLMAMLAAWLGLGQTLLVFFLAVVSGAIFALVLLIVQRKGQEAWAERQIPLGTFLCVSGIYAVFFGEKTLLWYESLLK